MQRKRNWVHLQSQLNCLGFKIKKGLIQEATFIYSDPGHSKDCNPRENKAKRRRSRGRAWTKKWCRPHFKRKVHIILDRDYKLIRRFKTTNAQVHDFQTDLSEKSEVFLKDRGYFGAKS